MRHISDHILPENACWTCGASMNDYEWVRAPREPTNSRLRVCPSCHWLIESLPYALQVMNMIRYVAELPLVSPENCGPRPDDFIALPPPPQEAL